MPTDLRRVLAHHLRSCCATTSRARWSSRSASSTDGDPRPSPRSRERPRPSAGGVARRVPREPVPVPRPAPRRVAVGMGALLRLRRHEGADRLPRSHPQGGDRRLPRDGHDAGGHAALREGQHRLPARALARAAHHGPAARPSACRTTPAPPRKSATSACEQIIRICREHGYDYVFAGYGFMAEDADVRARARGRRAHVHRPVLVHADGRRREGRGQAHRDREPGVGDARHQRRDRAHAAAQVSATTPRCAGAAKRARPRACPELGDATTPLETLAEAVLEASYRAARRPLHHRRARRDAPRSKPSALLHGVSPDAGSA